MIDKDEVSEIVSKSFESCYFYATNQMDKFIDSTDGPRHRALVEWIMKNKHINPLVRERVVAEVLNLQHNIAMHSTYNGETTFDATDTSSGIHYEIKTEQHNTIVPFRKTISGQVVGSGCFSQITCKEDAEKLFDLNPVIAHGIFVDGKVCGVATFKLIDLPSAVERILRHAQSSTKTAPKYLLSDWKDNPSTEIRLVSSNWPNGVAVSCQNTFLKAALKKHPSLIIL